MVTLTVIVNDLTGILQVYNSVQIRRYVLAGQPDTYVNDVSAFAEYVPVVGIDVVNNRHDVGDVFLIGLYDQYYFTDASGTMDDWYIYRFFNTVDESATGWFGPLQGGYNDFNYNPQFPVEAIHTATDRVVLAKIRTYIGDPKGMKREFGEEALSSIHGDGKIYEMAETGWPLYLNFGGVQYTSQGDPSVNGYRFLKFKDYIDDVCIQAVTYSGVCGEDIFKDVTYGIDIWYNTFRYSDRQILAAYDSCTPPPPLTSLTANTEVYLIQTSIDLLRQELWEDATEDGASVGDDVSKYNPEPGLKIRKQLLDDLEKRLDRLVKSLALSGIQGVRVD